MLLLIFFKWWTDRHAHRHELAVFIYHVLGVKIGKTAKSGGDVLMSYSAFCIRQIDGDGFSLRFSLNRCQVMKSKPALNVSMVSRLY